MQKLLLTLLVAAAGTMASFRALADPTPTMAYEIYFFNDEATNFQIQSFNYSVTSSQVPGLFQPPYTYTVSGSTAEPEDLITYGGYWFTPSSTQALTISVPSGLTASVLNTSGTAQNLRMGIEFAPNHSYQLPVLIYGSYTNIPGGQVGTINIPSGSSEYNAGALQTLFSSEPYPVPIAFFISD